MTSKPVQVGNGTRTYMINGDYIKFHTVFKDGTEIVEEYGLYSEELESRRVKKLSMTGKEIWETEVGEGPRIKSNDDFLIKENEVLNEIRKIRSEIKKNPDAKYDPGCKNQ